MENEEILKVFDDTINSINRNIEAYEEQEEVIHSAIKSLRKDTATVISIKQAFKSIFKQEDEAARQWQASKGLQQQAQCQE